MRLTIGVAATLLLSGCNQALKQEKGELPPGLDLRQVYQAAVEDARIAEPWEVSRTLKAINPNDPRQFWSNDGYDDHVLVLSWTNWRGFDELVGERTKLGRDLWVTVVPDVQNFCRAFEGSRGETRMRLKQLLGLPPGTSRSRFVEIWAKPQDMFRPSPDPEINDHEAQLDFPPSNNSSVSEDYQRWFNGLKEVAYDKDRRTWTRLGYTYDWGNTQYHVGPSEFVVKGGSVVTVHSISNLQEYCR